MAYQPVVREEQGWIPLKACFPGNLCDLLGPGKACLQGLSLFDLNQSLPAMFVKTVCHFCSD